MRSGPVRTRYESKVAKRRNLCCARLKPELCSDGEDEAFVKSRISSVRYYSTGEVSRARMKQVGIEKGGGLL